MGNTIDQWPWQRYLSVTNYPVFHSRNPLVFNSLVSLKEDSETIGDDAHFHYEGNFDYEKLNDCVMCDREGFGDLCEQHRQWLLRN